MKIGKLLLAVLALAFLLAGLWLYGNVFFPLERAMPDENWTKARLWWYDEDFNSYEITVDEETLAQVVTVLKETQVSHRQNFDSMTQPYFHLYLYHSEGYPTSFTIVENGDIAIAAELDTDHYRCFDGGEELYQYLFRFMQQLPLRNNS